MRILVVVEKTGSGFSAFPPDLPGCVATGDSRSEVEREIRVAIELHIEGMRAEGLEPPEPRSYATVVEVAA
ncbi:MAG TPA: type II toxin-antitoxin system HicB family antitoxin [Myxococcota bacterium]|nr:type II toxin-antitoxin system HicB family antitoxin [Myxococcota bacterium]